jgi:hypothetical protein
MCVIFAVVPVQASLEEKEAEVQKLKVRPGPCLMVKQPCPIPASLQTHINLRDQSLRFM